MLITIYMNDVLTYKLISYKKELNEKILLFLLCSCIVILLILLFSLYYYVIFFLIIYILLFSELKFPLKSNNIKFSFASVFFFFFVIPSCTGLRY